MEIYLLKSNSHYSWNTNRKVKLIPVKNVQSMEIFPELSILLPKLKCTATEPISNIPFLRCNFSNYERFKAHSTILRGEIITPDAQQDQKVLSGAQVTQQPACVQYKYTFQIAKKGEVAYTVTRTTSRPLSIQNIYLIIPDGFAEKESCCIRPEEVEKAKTMYPFVLEESDKLLKIQCPFGQGFRQKGSELCQSLSTLSIYSVVSELGFTLERTMTDSELMTTGGDKKSFHIFIKPFTTTSNGVSCLKQLVAHFIAEIAELNILHIQYNAAFEQRTVASLSDFYSLDRIRLHLLTLTILSALVEKVYSVHLKAMHRQYSRAHNGKGNQILLEALTWIKAGLELGKEIAQVDESAMTEEYLEKVVRSIPLSPTVDKNMESRITTILLNDFKDRSFSVDYFVRLLEDYLNGKTDEKNEAKLDLGEKKEIKTEVKNSLKDELSDNQIFEMGEKPSKVEIKLPGSLHQTQKLQTEVVNSSNTEKKQWNQLLWYHGLERNFEQQIYPTLLSTLTSSYYFDSKDKQVHSLPIKYSDLLMAVAVGDYFLTSNGYGESSKISLFNKEWKLLCTKSALETKVIYIRKLFSVSQKDLRVYLLASIAGNTNHSLINLRIIEKPEVTIELVEVLNNPLHSFEVDMVARSRRHEVVVAQGNKTLMIYAGKNTKEGLQKIEDLMEVDKFIKNSDIDENFGELNIIVKTVSESSYSFVGTCNDTYLMMAFSLYENTRSWTDYIYLINLRRKSSLENITIKGNDYNTKQILCFSKHGKIYAISRNQINDSYSIITERNGKLIIAGSSKSTQAPASLPSPHFTNLSPDTHLLHIYSIQASIHPKRIITFNIRVFKIV